VPAPRKPVDPGLSDEPAGSAGSAEVAAPAAPGIAPAAPGGPSTPAGGVPSAGAGARAAAGASPGADSVEPPSGTPTSGVRASRTAPAAPAAETDTADPALTAKDDATPAGTAETVPTAKTAAETTGPATAHAEAGAAAGAAAARAVVSLAKPAEDPAAKDPAEPFAGKVDLVKRDKTATAAATATSTKVDLIKVTKRPSPAHLRTNTTGTHRRPVRGAVGAVGRVARRGARGTRAWSRRPSGRMVLPGVLMLLVVLLTGAAGLAVEQVKGKPTAGAPAEPSPSGDDQAPDVGAEDPDQGLPGEGPDSDAGFVPGRRPADSLAQWASPMAVRTGVPVIALQAYAFAELVVGQESPTCHLRWTTLAGIGRVESDHGRGAGATLANDGRVNPAIMGLPLDGQGGRRAIPDTDSGDLDGDRTWDRAMGPMQFIPTTWARFAADGDFDGVTDPQDIDDAALAAGRYLCEGTRDLDTAEGWRAAILSYNNVQTYVDNVFTAANDYGAKSRV
jgi:hypothetical protein